MSTGTKSNASAALIGVGIVILVLGVAGTWFSGQEGDPSEPGGAPEEEPRLVILTAAWGHFEHEEQDWRFRDDDRDVTITFWVDGVEHSATRDDEPGQPWTEYLALHPGAEVRLLVEQHGYGGFLMCSISSNGKVLSPNGYMHRNDAGDCDVTGVVE